MNRKLHRWLGFAAAILFLYVAVTGVILQVQQLLSAEEQQKEALAQLTSSVKLGQPLEPTASLERARQSVVQRFGDRPVNSIDWQVKGPVQSFTFHLGGPAPLRVDVEAARARVTAVESDEEDFFVRLHSGEIIGDGGKFLGLGWGLGLIFMIVTGFVVYLQLWRSRKKRERTRGSGLGRWFWSVPAGLFLLGGHPTLAQAGVPQGFSFNPDEGMIYPLGDFRAKAWGYAERAIDLDGPDYFRRVRQGLELDLPRLSDSVRPAFVYEVDLTGTNVFGDFGRKADRC